MTACTLLIDNFTTNNGGTAITRLHPSTNTSLSAVGQCFTSASTNKTLCAAQFYLKKGGSPSGNLVARLYAITATFGTNGVPTGNALATSDAYNSADLTTSFQWITFVFSTPYTLVANTYYCIEIEAVDGTIDGSNYVYVGYNSTGGHSGNGFRYVSSNWISYATSDFDFYVYGILVVDFNKTFSDKIGCLDMITAAFRNVIKTFSNLLGLKDSTYKVIARLRSFADILGAKGVFNKNIGGAFFKTLTDSIGAIDSFVKQKSQHFTKIFSDIVGMLDSKTKIIYRLKVFLDKMGLKDSKFTNVVSGSFRWVWKEHPKIKVEKQ